MDEEAILFHEEQKSTQWWLWLGLAAAEAVEVRRASSRLGEAKSESRSIWPGILELAAAAAVPAVLAIAKLITEVRGDGLYIRYYPIHTRFHKISLEDVTNVEAVTYNPLANYGGWGIRLGRKGKAYNPVGNRGVRVEYSDGHHILIGSQKPEELVQAIETIRQ